MVVPTIERHAQYTSETAIVEFSPPVSPKLTSTPPHRNARSASGQQSAPQLSITASKPPPAACRSLDAQSGCEYRTPPRAPSPRTRSSFASVEVVTHTSPPTAAAIWTAKVATPLPAPVTKTRRPAPARAQVIAARQAVSPARFSAADSSHERPAGRGAMFCSGTTTPSAKVPSRGEPRISNVSVGTCSPAFQPNVGLITTSSPTETVSTPAPTAVTTPASSEP